MTTEHRDENHSQAAEIHQPRPAPTSPAGQAAVMTTMASVMPWVISLFFHAGVLVILAFITIVLLKTPTPVRGDPPQFAHLSEKLQDKTKLTTADSKLKSKLDKVKQSDWTDRNRAIQMPKLGQEKDVISVPGLQNPPIGNPRGRSKGRGTIFKTETGPPTSGPAKKPGPAGNARHIVYLVDCSGSMLDTFGGVRWEMIKSISQLGLRPDGQAEQEKQSMQTFHVIFFSSGKLRENPPRRLVYATKVNKLAAVKYLKTITPEKRTDPVPALKRAFAVLKSAPGAKDGKLIFLLTDGEFPDSEKVFRVINTLNADHGVHINTILHHHHSNEAVKVLGRIARENAGRFDFVEAE